MVTGTKRSSDPSGVHLQGLDRKVELNRKQEIHIWQYVVLCPPISQPRISLVREVFLQDTSFLSQQGIPGKNCNFFNFIFFFFSCQVAKERYHTDVHPHQIGQLQELKKKPAMLFG